jgi:hypothetical protein
MMDIIEVALAVTAGILLADGVKYSFVATKKNFKTIKYKIRRYFAKRKSAK